MSGYILCQVKKAEKPYFIKNISTSIYTIEELCYYLYNNIYLVDETIVNKELCAWLSGELGLTQLSNKLGFALGKFGSVSDFLYPIFKEINYLSYEELKALGTRLAKYETEAPLIRLKKKGDALMENGMTAPAMKIYRDLLGEADLESVREGLTASVCHNLGCACSHLFQMEQAQEYFLRAYGLTGNERELFLALAAAGLGPDPDAFKTLAKDKGASEALKDEVKDALSFKEERLEGYAGNADACLLAYTKEYHRSTMS